MPDFARCSACATTKPVTDFYFDRRRNRPRAKCAVCLKAYRKSRPHFDPAKKAEYRRRRGQVAVEYVPQSEREAQAAAKRAARSFELHSAHVHRYHYLTRSNAFYAARDAHKATSHDAHVCVYRSDAVEWRRRYRDDPEFNIVERVRASLKRKAKLFPKLGDYMREALNRNGNSNAVEAICGYTIAALRVHLEARFVDGMDWQAFARGEIHIDHVRPQSTFDLNDLDQVRLCWALANLQPLWARDNLTKGKRWTDDAAAQTYADATFVSMSQTERRPVLEASDAP